MRQWTQWLGRLLPHLTIALAAAVAVMVILEYFNPRMGFLTSSYSMAVIGLLALFALAAGIRSAARDRKERQQQEEQRPQ